MYGVFTHVHVVTIHVKLYFHETSYANEHLVYQVCKKKYGLEQNLYNQGGTGSYLQLMKSRNKKTRQISIAILLSWPLPIKTPHPPKYYCTRMTTVTAFFRIGNCNLNLCKILQTYLLRCFVGPPKKGLSPQEVWMGSGKHGSSQGMTGSLSGHVSHY